MPLKYMSTQDEWERVNENHKLKDNGLTKAFDEFRNPRSDEIEKRLAALPKILKSATDIKKSKEAVTSGATALKWLDGRLRPRGTVYLKVHEPMGVVAYVEGATDYEVKPGKSVMKFSAVQHSKTVKVRAKTMEEATEKIGVKGSVGLEFEILKVGGEVSKESEYKRGFEHEVE